MADDWEVAGTEPMPAGTTAGNNPWAVDSEEPAPPKGPQVTKPGGFKDEAAYQSWLDQHKPDPARPQDVEFNGTGYERTDDANHTLTVDGSGEGVTHDLRGLWNAYARPNPVTGRMELEPTAGQLDEFALPGRRGFTAASRFAHGVPPEQLGSWNDDHTEYHEPGWQPATMTGKVMDAAKSIASKAYDNVVSTATDPLGALDDAEKDVKDTIVNPLITGFQKARQGGNVLAGQAGAQSPESTAAGVAAAEKATPALPEFRRAAAEQIKNANGAFGVLDAYLSNPRAALASALQGLSESGASLGLAMGTGAAGGAVGGSVVPVAGTAVGAAGGTMGGAAVGGYFDTYGQTIVNTIRDSGVDMTDKDAVAKALKDPALMAKAQAAGRKAGIPAAVINALSFGVAGKVFKPVAGAVASKVGSELAGKAAGVAAEAGTQGAIGAGGEAARQKIQEGKITDPNAIAEAGTTQAALAGAFAGMHARKPLVEDADFSKNEGGKEGGKPFDINDVPPPSSPPPGGAGETGESIYPGYRWDDAAGKYVPTGEQPAAKALPGPKATPVETPETTGEKPAEAPPKPTATWTVDEATRLSDAANDAGDITVTHGDEGSVVSVNNEPVMHTDDPKVAEAVAADAKQEVEERRLDAAQRQKVSDMSPEELRQTLLTHELTGIPNRRAYDESEKLPVQASIDADSLKWVNDTGGHAAGDEVLKAIGQALNEATPGNAYHAYHLSGDEFTVQGADHETVDKAIAEARERLAGAKIEFTGPNGDKITLNGIGFSHGKGSTLAEADANLQAEKLQREQQGLRAARGEQPPTASRTPAEEGVQADEGHAASEEVTPPSIRDEKGNVRPVEVRGPIEPAESKPLSADEQADVEAATKPPIPAAERELPGHAQMGTNADGHPIFVDKNGVRSFVDENGVRTQEPVGLVPTRAPDGSIKYEYQTSHDDPRFQPVETKAPEGETEPEKSETHADLSEPEGHFVDTVRDRTIGAHNQKPVSNLVEARKMYGELHGRAVTPADFKRVDELVERAVVEAARSIVADGDTPEATYDRLVKLYERQPSLNTRTSTSIENQAYSTPAPLAYLSSDLAGITTHTTVLEPTAGNGMLLIAADPAMATVNELNDDRAASLKGQGFNVTQKDASAEPLGKDLDVVIMNPPFGAVRGEDGNSKLFSGTTPAGKDYNTTQIDHAIVLKQLEAMKADGRAVLLIGGVNKTASTPEARSDAYNGSAKRKFFYHLYNNYNVVDHFTVSGDLYSRQGAAWPIDALVIHGVGKSALPLPAASPPRVYDSYADLKSLLGKGYESNRLDTAAQAPAHPAGGDLVPAGPEAGQGNLPAPAGGTPPVAPGPVAEGAAEGGGAGLPGGTVSDGAGEGRVELSTGEPGELAGGEQLGNLGETHPLGAGEQQIAESETPAGSELDGTPKPPVGEGQPGGQPGDVGVGDGGGDVGAQEPYRPQSKQNNLGTLVPGNMRDAVRGSLEASARSHGSPDEFVAKELGYPVKKLGDYFAAEQVDALALAIQQIKAGKGFIIGDQTGIGKGRVVAGVIRWAIKQGNIPIFLTEKPNLYGDIVRDLRDIGVDDIRPLITDAGKKIPLEGGGEIKSASSSAHNKLMQDAVNSASLPQHNMLFTTYNQMQTIGGKEAVRHQLVNTLIPNAILILDESHNAGGTDAGRQTRSQREASGTPKTGRAAMIRGFVNRAKGVFYSSATYAKRPDVMDLYSKTDMRLAVEGNIDKLPSAIAAGGVPLQQVVASMLARSGQYIRRERSFEGVTYNTPVVPVSREAAEALSGMMLGIKEFDDLKQAAVKALKDEAKREAKQVSVTGEAGAAGANSTNFTSLMHNLIAQMLLSLKAEKAAQMAIEHLKENKKPVITVANTMGSFIQDYAEEAGLKNGDAIGLTFKDLMTRYLEASRKVTIKDQDGKVIEKRRLNDEELGPAAVAAFKRAKKSIDSSQEIREIPISPIDWMHMRLKEAGFKSGEITGRSHTIQYQPDGTAIYKLRPDKEKNTEAKIKSITAFNNGNLDAMILNQAGSTGLSLHASNKFKDQRKRSMIIAQAEGNIDTHMQMLGRVHRTGQVVLPEFNQLVGDVPAEKRPAAILAKKMASLSANTTGARGNALSSKESVDFLNDYGDEVAAQLMADMPETHVKLGEPLDTGDDGFEKADAARKVTGRIPLLPVAEQEELYHLLETGYNERLAQADAMGENALEAKTLPLDAKTLKKHVLFAGSNSDSPFADGAYAETSDVKRVGKPYTSAEVRQQVADKVGNATAETPLASLAAQGRQNMAVTVKQTMADYHQYRAGEEKKMLESEAKESAIEGRLTALDGVAKRWQEIAQTLHIGGSYEFRMQDGSSLYGVVTDISRKKGVKMPTALGAWVAKIALADGARTTTLSFSKFTLPQYGDATNKITVSPARHNQLTRVPIEQMFDDGQSTSREKRVIVTGNLLAGFSTIKGGQIINFTSQGGGVRQGIMMPRSFKLDEFVENAPVAVPAGKMTQFLSTAPQAILKSKDGNVQLQRWGQEYALMVSKSKADGSRYFLDPGLREMVGDFVSVGQHMRAMLRADQVAPAMRLIEQKFDQKFETATHRKEALAAGGTALGSEQAKPDEDDELQAAQAPAPAGKKLTNPEIGALAKEFVSKFAIKPRGIVVHKSIAEARKDAEIGERLRGDKRANPIAFYDPRHQKIHIMGDQIRDRTHLNEIVAHELIGHFGLRALWGSRADARYQAFLNDVAANFPMETQQRGRAEIEGFDVGNDTHRYKAAEEVLTYGLQRDLGNQSIPARLRRYLKELYGKLRDWWRQATGQAPKRDKLWLDNIASALETFLRSGKRKGGDPFAGYEPDAAFSRETPTFYSSVERAVAAARREKGTGAEWEATLRNMPGVKDEEMKWLGLKDFLEGKGRVTKAEIADYVAANKVQVHETLYGMGGTGGDEHIQALHQWMEDNTDPDEASQEELEEHAQLMDDVARGDTRAIGELEMRGVPEHLLAPFYDTQKSNGDVVEGAPRYPTHVEPGGKNYRELLLTLPSKDGDALERNTEQLAQANEALRARQRMTVEGLRDPELLALTMARDAIHRERTALMESRRQDYRSSHFDVPNVLVHARFDERQLPTGERALHIAEIQSDWHHAGWEQGYGKIPLFNVEGPTGVRSAMAVSREEAERVLAEEQRLFPDHEYEITPSTVEKLGVPDAPFKTTWQELALKRLLRHAVEKGFDALTWDTGQTVADRFNLSRRIGSVALARSDFRAYGHNGEVVHSETGMTPERAAQLIGKDAAEKLYALPVPENGWRQLQGLDLDQGSEGKKAIYDRMLPQKMAKIIKPFGGKVERGTVTSNLGNKLAEVEARVAAFQRAHGLDTDEPLATQLTELRPAARAEAFDLDREHERVLAQDGEGEGGENTIPAHIVRITDAMRAGVMEGLPMFARQPDSDLMFARRQKYGIYETNRDDKPYAVPPSPASVGFGGGKPYDLARRAVLALVDNELVMSIRRFVNPKDVSDLSKHTARVTIPYLGELAQQKHQALIHLEQFARAVGKLSRAEQLAMIDAIENGNPQPIKAMQPVADELRKILDHWRDAVHSLGEGYIKTFIEDYFPHYWKDPDAKSKGVFAQIAGRRPMRGPATFLKKRVYATLADGIEAGLTPITTNPLIHTLLKVHEMQRFISGVSMFEMYKNAGLAVFYRSSQRIPAGWKEIDDPMARKATWSEEEGGWVQRGRYAMPEDAARIVNNHLSSSQLRNFAPAVALRVFANAMNTLQLGFSAFHVSFTTIDALVSKAGLGFERLAHGEPLQAAKAFGETLLGPVSAGLNLRRGYRLLSAYSNPAGATPELQVLVKGLMQGGGHVRMDPYFMAAEGTSPFRGVGVHSLAHDIRLALTQPRGKVAGVTKAIANLPLEAAQGLWNQLADIGRNFPLWQQPFELVGRICRASTSFIMETIVPLQKLGVFADMAQDYLRRNPDADPIDSSEAMQSIWRSVDNRLGEVVYDNKFWNRTFKDALHYAIRAVGFSGGTVEEIGGAPVDFFKALDKLIRTGKLKADDFGHKIPYVMGMYVVTAVIASLIQYMYTGKGPQDAKDLQFPRTGGTTKMGTPERVSIPSYVKDVYEYHNHPWITVMHKLNPIWGQLYEQMTGTDYFGNSFTSPNMSPGERVVAHLKHLGESLLPFSVQGTKQFRAGQNNPVTKVMPYLGFNPAPGAVTSPEQMERREHMDEEASYEKGLRIKANQARAAKDRETEQKLRNELREAARHRREQESQLRRDRAAGRRPPTSKVLDHVHTLIDQGGSKGDIAERIHAAGYPALAGLIQSMPDKLRPQVAAKLQEYA